MKQIIPIIVVLLFFTSCKSLKNTSKIKNNNSIALNEVAQAHAKAAFSNQSLEAKIDALYDDGSTSQNLNIKLRIQKDKVIWMSGNFLGIPMAKIMITPEKIKYYEKLNKTYFDGDFSLLKEIFGVEMNFQQVQNLLLGQAFFDMNQNFFESQNEKNQYVLTPIPQDPRYNITYIIDPSNFKLINQSATFPNNDYFSIQYKKYQFIDNQYIPLQIIIESVQPNQKTKIFLDIRNVELGNNLNFPFDIPTGYEKLNFDDLKNNQ